jgi:hypothetical protein
MLGLRPVFVKHRPMLEVAKSVIRAEFCVRDLLRSRWASSLAIHRIVDSAGGTPALRCDLVDSTG